MREVNLETGSNYNVKGYPDIRRVAGNPRIANVKAAGQAAVLLRVSG